MFILIGEAYRTIETEHNPLLREARKRAADTYESGPTMSQKFKSRRPENRSNAFYDDNGEETTHEKRAHDWQEEKFLRRYRYQHLRSDSSVPMSIRNVDRHGLNNLKHDETKPLDRLKVPPWMIYIMFFGLFAFCFLTFQEQEDTSFVALQRKNILLAMKKTQERMEYAEEEITPAEEVTMMSTQYREVVENR